MQEDGQVVGKQTVSVGIQVRLDHVHATVLAEIGENVMMRSEENRGRRQDPAKLPIDDIQQRACRSHIRIAGGARRCSQLSPALSHEPKVRDVALTRLENIAQLRC
jgi:hypothetical protein